MRDIEPGQLAARRPEALHVAVVHGAGADRVDDHPHLDAAARGVLECRRETVGDGAGVVDVGLEADAPLRVVDGFEHRWKELVAVGEHVVDVAGAQIDAKKGGDIAGVAGILRRDGAAHPQRHLILRQHQPDGDDERGDEENDKCPADVRHAHARGAVQSGSRGRACLDEGLGICWGTRGVRLRPYGASGRQPSLGLPSRSSRFGVNARERRLAVREGFEPSVELLRPYNGLANRRLQPLGHLTAWS